MVQTAALRRPTKFSYVPALDGLRALLVLSVATFHFSITAGWEPAKVYSPGSFFAPSTFFALSGYLITSLLLAERERSGAINGRGFWARRFRRLLPASVIVIVFASVLTAIWGDLWGPLPGSDVAAGLFSLSNWQAIRLADAGESFRLLGPLGVFWSLGLEEQFYLGLFAVVMVASRTKAMATWMVGILVTVGVWSILSLVLIESTPQREYFGTDTRASELIGGCLVAVWVHHHGLPSARIWRWVGMVALVVTFLAWGFVHEDDPWVLHGGLSLFTLVNVGLILGASVPGPMARLLGVAPLVLIGRLSYPLYLIHWPMALILSPDRVGIIGWPLIALRLAVSMLLAWLVFRFLEEPMRTSGLAKWPKGLALWGIPALGALALAVVVSGWGWAG